MQSIDKDNESISNKPVAVIMNAYVLAEGEVKLAIIPIS